jgi:hypothetical protein
VVPEVGLAPVGIGVVGGSVAGITARRVVYERLGVPIRICPIAGVG